MEFGILALETLLQRYSLHHHSLVLDLDSEIVSPSDLSNDLTWKSLWQKVNIEQLLRWLRIYI